MTRSAAQGERLQRRIGLIGATASGVGIVLGAGIYVLVGEAAGLAGNGVWAAFLVGALLAAGTGLSYAELASMFPEAGAAAAYAKEAFGPRVAFVAGWMDTVVNTVGAPAVALGFAGYLAALTGLDRTLIAVAVVLLCSGIVLLGVVQTIRLASLLAVVELSGLLFVAVVGVPHLGSVNLLTMSGGAGGLLAAAALVFFAYEGFEEIATLSEEVEDPTRNLPRALIISVLVTAVIYVLVAAVAVSVVPSDELADADAPLAEVVAKAASPRLGDALSFLALFATFNTVLLLLATAPRAMYGMARRNLLPSALGRVSSKRGTPWVATLLVTAVAALFALTGTIGFVAQVTNFAVFTLFVIVNGALIRLRFTRPDVERPFRAGPSLGAVPIPAIVGLGGALVLAGFMQREAFAIGLAALLAGVALSFLVLRRGAGQAAGEGRA